MAEEHDLVTFVDDIDSALPDPMARRWKVVVIDDDPALACTTPCSLLLEGGRHRLIVSKAGYRDVFRDIEVPREAKVAVEMALITGTLTLTTKPAGLTVLIDDQEQPRKTPMSVTLPVGDHRVRVVNGAAQQDFTVQIVDGGITAKAVEWQ